MYAFTSDPAPNEQCPDCGRNTQGLDREANECLGCGRPLGGGVPDRRDRHRHRSLRARGPASDASTAATCRAALVGRGPAESDATEWARQQLAVRAKAAPPAQHGPARSVTHQAGEDDAATRREVARPQTLNASPAPRSNSVRVAATRTETVETAPATGTLETTPASDKGTGLTPHHEPDLDLASARRDDAQAVQDSLLEVSGLRARRRNMLTGSLLVTAAAAIAFVLAMM